MDQTIGRGLDYSSAEPSRKKEYPINTQIKSPEGIEQKLIEITQRTDQLAMDFAEHLEKRGWKAPKVTIDGQEFDADPYAALKEPLDNGAFHGNAGVKEKGEKGLLELAKEKILERLGNGGQIPGELKVTVEDLPDRTIIEIEDQGQGFDWRKIKDPLTPENLMRTHGRGLYITFQTFGLENVQFNEKGNKITITALIEQK